MIYLVFEIEKTAWTQLSKLCPGGRLIQDTVPCGYSTIRQFCIRFMKYKYFL